MLAVSIARRCLLAMTVIVAALCHASVLPVTWSVDDHSTGPNAPAGCLMRWQGDVVIAGQFDAVGRIATPSHVARLRDGAWEPVGTTVPGSEVLALVVHETTLHALVLEGTIRRVVRFDGESWITVGEPCPTTSTAMASFQGDLHVGSHRLEGEAWVDRLQTDGAVHSLVVMDDVLVSGGAFTSGAGVMTGHVLAWDGTNVIDAFAGQDSTTTELAVWEGQLFAARRAASQYSATAVQVWQGGVWVDIPQLGVVDPARHVTDLEAGDGRLLVCGYWESFLQKDDAGAVPERALFGAFASAWDGVSAQSLNEAQGFVEYRQILEDAGDVLVAGAFEAVGQPTCANLGRVIAGAMTPICDPGHGASNKVLTLESSGNAMVAGGSFTSIGGVFSRCVAVRQSGTWSARDLCNGEELGEYDSYGTVGWHAGYLVVVADGHFGRGAGYWTDGQWNMTEPDYDYPWCDELLSWNGMLLGNAGWGGVLRFGSLASPTTYAEVDRRVIDIATVGADLLVGGDFATIAGVSAANVAARIGGAWQPLGGGLPDQVWAVGSWQGQAVAATWNGSDSDVYLLAGDHWEVIGTLMGGYVRSLAEYEGLLFVAGSFDSPADDGTPMAGLACWTGTQWRGVGALYSVTSMAVHDQRLWLGGSFHFAGGTPAWHLTSLTVDEVSAVEDTGPTYASPLLARAVPNPFNPRTTVSFDLPAAAMVRLDVYDSRGAHVVRLVDGHQPAGRLAIEWDGRDGNGRELPSGVYLLRLEAGTLVSTAKTTLAR